MTYQEIKAEDVILLNQNDLEYKHRNMQWNKVGTQHLTEGIKEVRCRYW